MTERAPWQAPVAGGVLAATGALALIAVALLPPPPATLPPVRATEGFTEWGWGRAEAEIPLYKVPREAGADADVWTLYEESEAQLELEPFGVEPVRVMVPLAGRVRGSDADLDGMRGEVSVDLGGLSAEGALGEVWDAILARHPDAATATVVVRGGRLGPAPDREGGRTEGDLLLTVRFLGAEARASVPVEVERVEGGGLVVSTVGRSSSLPLDTLGPLAGLLEAGLGRHPGALLVFEFGVELEG